MTDFRRPNDRNRYHFVDAQCIGATCWSPGLYQHRGASSGGSRSTGTDSPCCLNNAYRGCPPDHGGHDVELVKLRKKEGWRKA